MPAVPLDQMFPTTPTTTPSSSLQIPPASATLSVLPSGLKVAVDTTHDNAISLGIHVRAGTSVETDVTSGLTHLMSAMAFRSTQNRSALRLYRDLENIGGTITSHVARDSWSCRICVLPDQVETAAALLAEATIQPKFATWDVMEQRKLVGNGMVARQGNPMVALMDGLFAAAFYDSSPIGRSWSGRLENVTNLTRDHVVAYHHQYMNTQHVALVGTGLNQDTMMRLGGDYFDALPSDPTPPIAVSASPYVGGESRQFVYCDTTHMALGFNGMSWSNPQHKASFVVQALLEMKLKSLSSVDVTNACFPDAGLMALTVSTTPDQSLGMLHQLVEAVQHVKANTTESDIERARTMAAWTFATDMMARETRFDVFGNMALHDRMSSVSAIVDELLTVTNDQVQSCADTMLKSAPSFSCVGNVSSLPRYNALVEKFN